MFLDLSSICVKFQSNPIFHRLDSLLPVFTQEVKSVMDLYVFLLMRGYCNLPLKSSSWFDIPNYSRLNKIMTSQPQKTEPNRSSITVFLEENSGIFQAEPDFLLGSPLKFHKIIPAWSSVARTD